MANNLVVFLLIVCNIQNIFGNQLGKCVQESPCICKFNDYALINITTILDEHKQPYLTDTDINTSSTYHFAGCIDATINGNISFSLLQKNLSEKELNKTYTTLGTAKDIVLDIDTNKNSYKIVYKNKNATVFLLCDQFSIPFFKVLDAATKQFIVSSPNVCPIYKDHTGLSGGAVFLLLLFITALMYFVGGALILYFIRGARGIEIVPNIEFWTNLPGLVKDGLVFLLSGCRPSLVTTSETYDRI